MRLEAPFALALRTSCLLVALGSAACDTPNTRFTEVSFGDTIGLAAGGNLRLITQRQRQNSRNDTNVRTVYCAEPTPDYLVTVNRDADVTIPAIAPGQTSGSNQLSLKVDETGREGQGRTAGVLALRDGLYAACQAYANGLIGQDAYSVILSQYGMLVAAVASGPSAVATNTVEYKQPVASAFAAVLVACLSANDPTRLNFDRQNPLLSPAACRQVMAKASSGQLK